VNFAVIIFDFYIRFLFPKHHAALDFISGGRLLNRSTSNRESWGAMTQHDARGTALPYFYGAEEAAGLHADLEQRSGTQGPSLGETLQELAETLVRVGGVILAVLLAVSLCISAGSQF